MYELILHSPIFIKKGFFLFVVTNIRTSTFCSIWQSSPTYDECVTVNYIALLWCNCESVWINLLMIFWRITSGIWRILSVVFIEVILLPELNFFYVLLGFMIFVWTPWGMFPLKSLEFTHYFIVFNGNSGQNTNTGIRNFVMSKPTLLSKIQSFVT